MSQPANLTIALVLATPGTSWGGMEKHTADLANSLAHRGHDVHVIGHRSYRERFALEVHFHPVPVQLGRRNPWLHWRLRHCVRKIAPDILHAQGNKAAQLIGNLKPGMAKARIGTVHGIKSSHRAFRKLDAVIAVSKTIFNAVDMSNKYLIYNGVLFDDSPSGVPWESDESRLRGADNIANVIAVGRLEPVKGFKTLIKAWSHRPHTSPPAHLTIFGEGSEMSQLKDLISQLELHSEITLAGFCTDMRAEYQRADLTAITSEREGFSYVLIESLLAHCPVISTPVAGPEEILPAGAISESSGTKDFSRLLWRTIANLPEVRHQQRETMALAEKIFTINRMTDDTERVYYETNCPF